MHVITVLMTDSKHLETVLKSLKKLHVHIDNIVQKSRGIEIVAEAYTETPDDLIYQKLYAIKGVKKIFAKVLKENKILYA